MRTLVAPATPAQQSALAVVRLSGPQAFAIASTLAEPPAGGWPHATAVVRLLRDEQGAFDQALVLAFHAPRSVTGEDVVEFHVHGNVAIVAHVVERAVAAGAALAGPGAFTRRAVLHGRMGLPEVEALADLLEAQSPRGAAYALERLRGNLRAWGEATRAQLVDLLAELTAQVDFPEEGLDTAAAAELAARLRALAQALVAAADRGARARLWQTGAHVVLVGAPNAGKSTLLNRLLGAERAIVSPWAGTTRDVLEVATTLGGVPMRLIDTAGVRAAGEAIEAEGVRRAVEQARAADLVLHVRAPDATEDAALRDLLDVLDPARVLTVWNKRDLLREPPAGLVVSARDDGDLAPLIAAIAARLAAPAEDPLIGNLRQERACRAAAVALARAATQADAAAPPEIIAEDVQAAARALADLLGEVDAEAVLDRVFQSFCIGK